MGAPLDDRSWLTRRRFLRGASALALGAAAASTPLGLAVAADDGDRRLRRPGSLPFPDRPAGEPQPDLAPELAPIEHIVLVMQENHSFDSYLGMLPHRVRSRRRVDGFPRLDRDGRPAVVQEDALGQRFQAFPMPNACQLNGHPGQNWIASHTAFDGGRLDGFVRASGEVAVGFWDDRTLPFYYSLATHFPVCDRFFCSTLAQTFPNRVFAMAATAAGLIATTNPPPEVHPANGHLFDLLEAHGIDWVDFFTDLPSPGLFGRAWALARLGSRLIGPTGSIDGTLAALRAVIQAGTLPPVVMVEPDFGHASEENPQNVQAGEKFVAGVAQALMANPKVWERTLLVWYYDEHGGYYDHVPPPRALNPGDGSHPLLPAGVPSFGDDYTRLGFRVPAVVVSPWARRDFVSHTVFDHTSVLRTIEIKWNLPALTLRDANANDLRECLVRRGPAPFLEPPALVAAPASQPTGDPVADSNFCATTPGAAGQLPPPLPGGDR
ncbi:MAG TPA: alkaline phosphatase family protein [Terriglobales bacterium]|nr:alkaline phosphatase family protein [Terriglobales bacterium]